MYIDFKMLKVKVPIIFSRTQGFPAHRDGRYYVAKPYILTQDSNAIDLIGYPQSAACNALHSQIMPRHKDHYPVLY